MTFFCDIFISASDSDFSECGELIWRTKREELKKLLELSGEMLDGAEGLIAYQVIESENQNKPFVFIANWDKKASFDQAMDTPQAREFHSKEEIKKLHEETIEKATTEFYSPMLTHHA